MHFDNGNDFFLQQKSYKYREIMAIFLFFYLHYSGTVTPAIANRLLIVTNDYLYFLAA